jgi:hypothetical protein
MVKHRPARYTCDRCHNTSSVSDMLEHLQWPTLKMRHIQPRISVFYKIIQHIAIYPKIFKSYRTIRQDINVVFITNKFKPIRTLLICILSAHHRTMELGAYISSLHCATVDNFKEPKICSFTNILKQHNMYIVLPRNIQR